MTTELSGVDLARVALQNARAAAKNAPKTKAPRRRAAGRTGSARSGRDPMSFGDAIGRMMFERGWETCVSAGSILDQWPTIAPELVGKVTAEGFDEATGTLALRPVSNAYATQLRLHRRRIVELIQTAPGGRAVTDITVLPVGHLSAPAVRAAAESVLSAPAPASLRTRDTASDGYRRALAAHLEHRRTPANDIPLAKRIAAARARQDAALRAKRLPEDEHTEFLAEQERLTRGQPTDTLEASIQAALAYKRHGDKSPEPRTACQAA